MTCRLLLQTNITALVGEVVDQVEHSGLLHALLQLGWMQAFKPRVEVEVMVVSRSFLYIYSLILVLLFTFSISITHFCNVNFFTTTGSNDGGGGGGGIVLFEAETLYTADNNEVSIEVDGGDVAVLCPEKGIEEGSNGKVYGIYQPSSEPSSEPSSQPSSEPSEEVSCSSARPPLFLSRPLIIDLANICIILNRIL